MPTLLIVRPVAQAAADRQTCTAAGWQGNIFSPFAIEADTDALARLPGQFQTASAVFWVSPSAVAVAAPHLEFSDRSPPQIAVGGSSARALQAYSRTPVWFPDDGNDSEAVLRLPLWQTLPQGAAVLIVRGHGGREFLAHQLTLRGFNRRSVFQTASRTRLDTVCRRTARCGVDYLGRIRAPAVCRRTAAVHAKAAILAILHPPSARGRGTPCRRRDTGRTDSRAGH